MDITVYLPDDIGAQAKEAGMPFSQMLRKAVVSELDRTEALKGSAKGAEEWLLDLEDEDGEPYQGRIVGILLCESRNGEQIFVTDDERVIHYDPDQLEHSVLEDEDEIRETVEEVSANRAEYIAVMAQLGLVATVDL